MSRGLGDVYKRQARATAFTEPERKRNRASRNHDYTRSYEHNFDRGDSTYRGSNHNARRAYNDPEPDRHHVRGSRGAKRVPRYIDMSNAYPNRETRPRVQPFSLNAYRSLHTSDDTKNANARYAESMVGLSSRAMPVESSLLPDATDDDYASDAWLDTVSQAAQKQSSPKGKVAKRDDQQNYDETIDEGYLNSPWGTTNVIIKLSLIHI